MSELVASILGVLTITALIGSATGLIDAANDRPISSAIIERVDYGHQ